MATRSACIYLASRSPRRRELLDQIGVGYSLIDAAVDESRRPGEAAADYVLRLAAEKAAAGWVQVQRQGLAPLPVLGADTSVVLDETVLGKPVDKADAIAMLSALAGRSHRVLTGVCLHGDRGPLLRLSSTEVWFRAIGAEELERYWASGEPADKAGAYGIQGLAAVFVERIAGSYSGVVGLPLFETAELLRAGSIAVGAIARA